MNEIFSPKSFVFNSHIESSYLKSLYEDDYVYIEKIFQLTYTQLEEDIAEMPAILGRGSVVELQQKIHKIKPCFGYVGMLHIEEICRVWEEKSKTTPEVNAITEATRELIQELERGKKLIREEYQRLYEFNHKAA